MQYVSTRGGDGGDFRTVMLRGLAGDGGLFVPASFPEIDADEMRAMADLRYPQLAARVIGRFTGDFSGIDELEVIAADVYGRFSHPDVAPIVDIGDGRWLMELFHGPTLAFKDMAMQMLGRLFDLAVARSGARATILGATSGDTGAAALEAFRDRDSLDVAILYPHGRVSEAQRRQMTTVDAPNAQAIAIDGTFDDCQDIVKALFADRGFSARVGLSTANSINWARVVAQIAYYVWGAVRFGAPDAAVSYAVPSGNFGNVYSGYVAKRMGIRIDRFIVGSNHNQVLSHFLETGDLVLGDVEPTIAPSMDIQIPSNLERLLFEIYGRDGRTLDADLRRLRASSTLSIRPEIRRALEGHFLPAWFTDDEIRALIADVHAATGMIVDPHTAVGIGAARAHPRPTPVICLGTAHPAKFPAAVADAIGVEPDTPPALAALDDAAERVTRLPADVDAVRDHLLSTVRSA